jgi:hypothetical protein
VSKVTRTIRADKEGVIEYLRQQLEHGHTTNIRSPKLAYTTGYREGLEFAIGVLEDWEDVPLERPLEQQT